MCHKKIESFSKCKVRDRTFKTFSLINATSWTTSLPHMAPRLQTFSTYHLLQNSLVKRLWAVYMTFMSMFWHFVTSFLMKNNFRYLMMKVFRDGWLSENLSLSAIENKRKSHLCLTRLKKIFSFSLKACGSAAIIKHSHGLLTIRVETRAKKKQEKNQKLHN